MPTDSASPSAGWRAVYAAMGVSPRAEASHRPRRGEAARPLDGDVERSTPEV